MSHPSVASASRFQPRRAIAATLVGASMVALSLSPLVGLALAVPPGTPQWADIRNLPVGTEGSMGGWIGGSFYLTHGHVAGNSDTNRTWRYDPMSDVWSARANATVPRAEGVGVVVNGILYAIGGRGAACGGPNATCSVVEAYSPSNDTWWSVTPLPTPMAGLGGAGMGTTILVWGGRDGSTPTTGNVTNVSYMFDTSTQQWSPATPLPDARSELSASLYHPVSNAVYFFGGFNGTALSSSYRMNLSGPEAFQWRVIAPMPTARYAAIAGYCNADIIVAGGITGGAQSRARTNVTEVFSTATGTWTNGIPMPLNFSEAANGAVGNGTFIMAAGSGIHGATLNRTVMYDCQGVVDPQSIANDGAAGEGQGQPGGGQPPGGGSGCSGSNSASGVVQVTGGAPNGPVRVRATGPCQSTGNVSGSDFGAGASFALTGLPGSPMSLEAFIDENGNSVFDGQERISPMQNVTPPVSGVTLVINLSGGGGPGGPGPGPGGPGPGGPGAPQGPGSLWVNGTSFYNGSRTPGQLFFGIFPVNESQMGFFGGLSGVGSFNLSGFEETEYDIFSWMETDNVGGPGLYEPLGFMRVGGVDIGNILNFTAPGNVNRTDVAIEYRDPPGDEGWPPEMIPSGGPAPGGPGGPGGCDASLAQNVTGTVLNEFGGTLNPQESGVEVINLTSNQRSFVMLDSNSSYRCGVPPGNYRVEAHSPQGFAFGEVTITANELEHLNLTVSFNARPPYSRPTTFFGGTAWGNVTSGGAGVDGARISIFRAPEEGSFGGGGPGNCQPEDVQSRRLSTCGGEAETNRTGGFVVTYLANGVYDLFIDGAAANPPVQSQFFPRAVTVSNASGETITTIQLAPFAFSAPAYIRGYVNRSDGSGGFLPVAGAEVNAWPQCMDPGSPCMGGWDESNATGYYSMVVSPGEYGMMVRTGNRYAGPPLSSAQRDCFPGPGSQCVNVTQGNVTWVNFTMTAGSLITGRITDGEGNGVRAFLNAMDCPPPPQGPGQPQPCRFSWGQTDFTFGPGGGFYNLTVVPGTYEIRVEADRFERPDLSVSTVRGVVVTDGNTTYLNVTLGAGARLRGNITAGGSPVQYVNLFAQPHVVETPGQPSFPQPPVAWAFADSSGAYDMRGIPAGSYDVVVEPGFGSNFMRTTVENVTINTSETRWLDIRLSGGGTLAGYVLTPDGAPISGAFVDAFWQPDFEPGGGPGGPGFFEFPASGGFGHDQTDANGFYSIGGLTNGTFGMFVNPPFGSSYQSAHLDPFRDELPQVAIDATTYRNFTLGAGGQIRGCVVNPSAQPVPFAWVSAFSMGAGFGGGEGTQSDGCFTIRGVAAGTYEVEVNPPFGSEFGRTRVSNVVVTAGATTDMGQIALSAGVRLAGRVLDGDGNPIAGVFVNAFQIFEGGPGGGPGAFGFGVTDALGRYNLSGLEEGKYGMHIQPPFGSQQSAKFVPEVQVPSTGRYGYDITLGGGGWITGRVLVGSTPLANAWVGGWSFAGGSGSGTLTGSDGRFNLTGLSPATDYNFDVFPPFNRQDLAGHHAFPVTVTASQGTAMGDIVLETGGTLRGRVLDASGTSVQYAFVNVNGNNTFGWGMTDSSGNFSVQGLRATAGATLEVFVQPNTGGSAVPTRVTHTWAPNDAGVSDAGNITLSAGVNLTGFISRGGVGVADVDVFVWPALPYQGPPIGGSATTSSSGWFNLTGLPQGQTWDVSVQPRDGAAGTFVANAVTTNASTTYYNVTLGAGAGLVVRLLNGGAAPLQDGSVDCFSPTLRAGRGGDTNAAGYANFTGLPGGTFECRFFKGGYAPSGQNVTLTAGETLHLNVTLSTTTVVAVHGNFSTGNSSSPNGYFVVVVPNGTVESTETTGFNTTNSTGGFAVSGMPAGPRYDIKILSSSGTLVAARYDVDIGTGTTYSAGTITAGTFGS